MVANVLNVDAITPTLMPNLVSIGVEIVIANGK